MNADYATISGVNNRSTWATGLSRAIIKKECLSVLSKAVYPELRSSWINAPWFSVITNSHITLTTCDILKALCYRLEKTTDVNGIMPSHMTGIPTWVFVSTRDDVVIWVGVTQANSVQELQFNHFCCGSIETSILRDLNLDIALGKVQSIQTMEDSSECLLSENAGSASCALINDGLKAVNNVNYLKEFVGVAG